MICLILILIKLTKDIYESIVLMYNLCNLCFFRSNCPIFRAINGFRISSFNHIVAQDELIIFDYYYDGFSSTSYVTWRLAKNFCIIECKKWDFERKMKIQRLKRQFCKQSNQNFSFEA